MQLGTENMLLVGANVDDGVVIVRRVLRGEAVGAVKVGLFAEPWRRVNRVMGIEER